jgi:hypothetical protein
MTPTGSPFFSKKWVQFALLQAAVLLGLLALIAGNDRLFRSTVPIEQRLVSRNEAIRKKAQQELLGFESLKKKDVASKLIPALQQADPFVTKWAAISLALIGPSAQESIPFLLQAVSAREKDAAQAVRVALTEIGAPDAQQLPSLLRALQDPRDAVRCEAAVSIGKMGPDAREVVPVLIGYIQRSGESPACFEEALASLAASVPSVYPPILQLLASSHVELRRKAAHVLERGGVRSPDTIVILFDVLAKETATDVRISLARALHLPYTPASKPEEVLVTALKTDYTPVRFEAARLIRQSAPYGKEYLGLILRMIRDKDSGIRRLGLEALRRSGQSSPDILQLVARAQRDDDPGVRCRAAESLIEFGSPDRVSIALLMGDLRRDEDTARCAENVLGLAGLFDSDVVYSMMHLVEREKDPDVRSRAARVLMHLGSRARQAEGALLRAKNEKVPGAEMALKAIRVPVTRQSTPRRRR